jgi:hypothetical protein
LLLLHALIPQGFMPVAATDGFIGLCPDAAPMPPGMVMHHAQHSHGHDHSGGGDHGRTLPCVFAAGAGLASAPDVVAVALPPAAVLRPAAPRFASRFTPAIVRAQLSRGPPQLSS